MTLQLLFIDDITKLSTVASPAVFTGAGWLTFLQKLASVYQTGGVTPQIASPTSNVFLESLSFKGAVKVEGKDCKTLTSKLIVGYKEVKDGLLALHGAYLRHCNAIFTLISQLVITIQDGPNQYVRLNPAVVKGDSKAYVNRIRDQARQIIADFYVEVEQLYVGTIKNMQLKAQ
jgi:hypothetical protein